MKRILILSVLLLSSCTLPDMASLLPQPSPLPPTETATQTAIPSETPTITPTQPTPTFTTTPTLLGWEPSPTNAPTETPDPRLPSETPTAEPLANWGTSTPKYSGFLTVFLQYGVIYWGSCAPNATLITATVENPRLVDDVILFVRLKDKKFEDETEWRGVTMDKKDNGLYTYTLHYKNLNDYGHFTHAWVLYQLVATDKKGNIVGRTPVTDNRLSLEACP